MVAVSKASSPESNPNSPRPVIALAGLYRANKLIGAIHHPILAPAQRCFATVCFGVPCIPRCKQTMPLLPGSPKPFGVGVLLPLTLQLAAGRLHTESGFIGCSWGTCSCSPQFPRSGPWAPLVLRRSFLGQCRYERRRDHPRMEEPGSRPPERWGRLVWVEGKEHSLLTTLSGWLRAFGSSRASERQSGRRAVPEHWSGPLCLVLTPPCLDVPSGASRSLSRTGISDGLPCISPGMLGVS